MFIRQERSLKDFFNFYPIVSILVIVNFFLWFIIDFTQSDLGRSILMWGVGDNLLIYQGEYWRLLTPIFLHGGLRHALFNSFSLVIFGPALEQMLGKVRFIIVYLLTGLIGNLATLWFGPEVYSHLGASGAIFGLLGLYMYMVMMRRDLIDGGNAQIAIIITIIGLVMTFIRPGINMYAHLFGLFGGIILGPLFLHNVEPFSIWRNVARQRQKNVNQETIQFDPKRWQRNRGMMWLKKNIIWVILAILVLFGLFGRF